jgi:hypothetical protein
VSLAELDDGDLSKIPITKFQIPDNIQLSMSK